ncbi:MAG: hypothetical protein KA383_14585 [Phycisphaerae bacterium]|nr:hypothetical protein [Phycisphaerae bacterium]
MRERVSEWAASRIAGLRLARRPRSRLRRAVEIGCAVLLGAILLSMIWSLSYEGALFYASFDRGSLFFSMRESVQPEGWSLSLSRTALRFMFNLFPSLGGTPPRYVWRGYVPLWIPLALLALLTAALWWRERRPFPPGCCRTCGYDLRGNQSGRCPECGVACAIAGERAGPAGDISRS